jgi:hypothetical protein
MAWPKWCTAAADALSSLVAVYQPGAPLLPHINDLCQRIRRSPRWP